MNKELKFSMVFDVPARIIYNALLDPFEVMKYTRAKAEISKQGGKFSLYEGKIVGNTLEIVENKLIKQEWKFSEWEEFSIVSITFKDREDSCKIEIHQTNLPPKVVPSTLEEGWKNQIFKPMSQICGYPLEED